MTTQYNVPIKVLDRSQEYMIEHVLRPYRVFSDRSGNLKNICFSRESFPFVGDFVIMKTLRKEAAELARDALRGVEGLMVLPTVESCYEENRNYLDIFSNTR